MRRPRMSGKIVGDMLDTFADADVLRAADLRQHLHPTEKRRGRIDKGGCSIEGIRRDTVHPDVRMVGLEIFNSIFKLFQVDITGMFRMTSRARYCKEGVGSSRPNWRWIMCFLERRKAYTSCKAVAKCVSFS